MRRVRFAVILLLLPGCLGPTGPELPSNVGTDHASEETSGAEAQEPAVPVDVGTRVWANFRNTGFFFHGVVVERREEQHHVIYADGASEWVDAERLRPDSLGAETAVHVRPGYDQEYAEGVVGRRLGDAVYVRFASGTERWTALPQIRFRGDAEGAPRRGDEPYTHEAGALELGAAVLVNYQGQGLGFAGVVTAIGDEHRLHVVYLDGEREWVDPGFITPEGIADTQEVHVRRRWEPPEWVRGRVQQRVDYAFHAELDDGGLAWTSLFRIRAPIAGATPAEPAEPAEDAEIVIE